MKETTKSVIYLCLILLILVMTAISGYSGNNKKKVILKITGGMSHSCLFKFGDKF